MMMTYQDLPVWQRKNTLLVPNEHRTVFEAKMVYAEYIFRKNFYGEYTCLLQPLTMNDYDAFEMAGRRAQEAIYFHMERKEPKEMYWGDREWIKGNQLYQPKINIEVSGFYELHDRDCSVNGFFRDLPRGEIVFNVDYLDFYEQDEPQEVKPPVIHDDDNDW